MGPEMGWLGGLHQTVGSIGQMTELLGMNADAMQYAFGALAHFLERVGSASHEVLGFFLGQPPPAVDPRTGQPMPVIDPRTGQPVMDPRTGQPLRPPTPEEFREMRKRRLLHWLSGVVVLYVAYRIVRAMLTGGGSPASAASASHAALANDPALNAAFFSTAPGGFAADFPAASRGGPSGAGLVAAGAVPGSPLSDPFEAAFSSPRKSRGAW